MKLKVFKIFFSLIVFTYVFSTVGMCVIAHYCGGELEKVSLFSKPSSCCDTEDEDMDDCCKNDERHVQLHQDFIFQQLVSDCKTPVLNFSIFDFQFPIVNHVSVGLFSGIQEVDFYSLNFVQSDIVSHSVIRI